MWCLSNVQWNSSKNNFFELSLLMQQHSKCTRFEFSCYLEEDASIDHLEENYTICDMYFLLSKFKKGSQEKLVKYKLLQGCIVVSWIWHNIKKEGKWKHRPRKVQSKLEDESSWSRGTDVEHIRSLSWVIYDLWFKEFFFIRN